MVLSHAKDMTQAYIGELGKDAQAAPSECVLTVPAFATVHERRALLDAAALADLNVLGLLEENTAAALHYAMDKQFPEPQIFVFYNMGGTSVQVSVVKFHNYNMTEGLSAKSKTVGAMEVLSKAWDATLGGQSFDHVIVNHLADTFNQQWDKRRNDGKKMDVRTVPRAMTKLRLQANKVKHVLSANQEIPIYIDALHDDIPLSTQMTRDQLEALCADLIDRATKPVHQALAYANISLDDVDGLEMIGGGMRIPRIQTDLKKALNDIELGMHINGDESMALGAAFYGANLSTAFRVRHVGLADVNPFPIRITLQELAQEEPKKGLFGGGGKKKEKDPADDDNNEPWGKNATMLKAFGKLGVKKTIAFTHDKDIHCALDYEADAETLPQGTP
jgi:hypoxia up-regulated 1